MLQIVLEQPGRFASVQTLPPKPREGEALLRVHRIGICGTDLHAFAGRQPFFNYPRILGHELSGEVVEVAPRDSSLHAGDRCAVEPYLNCGQCHACKIGKYNCCERIQVMGVHADGGMRGFLPVPTARLHKSSQLTFDQLALVETLGIGAHAVARSGLAAGEEALIVGAGPVGLSVLQFARLTGARVRVLDVSALRREFVARLGVETLAEPESCLADVVFDATGNASAMEQSLHRVAHGGRVVFVGLVQSSLSIDDTLFHRREMTLLATRNSCRQFPRIIRMIERGEIDTRPWVTHRMLLREVPRVFPELAKAGNFIKAMVETQEIDL